MSTASVLEEHPGPFTLADLEAMPHDGRRFELIDGSLYVTPSPTPLHQRAAGRLRTMLDAVATPGLEALEAIDIQCGPDTVLEPDVVVVRAKAIDGPERVIAARHVALVAEIASPSSERMDRILKPQLYADAGIPTYLLIETKQPTVTWYGLTRAGLYTILRSATGTESLHLTAPFELDIVPEDLIRPRD